MLYLLLSGTTLSLDKRPSYSSLPNSSFHSRGGGVGGFVCVCDVALSVHSVVIPF